MRRCEDVKMRGWDVKMWRCEDVKMWRCEDVKMWRCEDVKMWGCEDERMRCEYVKMWRCEDDMRRCQDVRMWRCEDVRMGRCDEKMWWQTSTIRRTLRSDALGNKNILSSLVSARVKSNKWQHVLMRNRQVTWDAQAAWIPLAYLLNCWHLNSSFKQSKTYRLFYSLSSPKPPLNSVSKVKSKLRWSSLSGYQIQLGQD